MEIRAMERRQERGGRILKRDVDKEIIGR